MPKPLSNLQFQSQALQLRAERQAVLAGNIANADTPRFKARDIDFSRALADATGESMPSTPSNPSTLAARSSAAVTPGNSGGALGGLRVARSDGRHIDGLSGSAGADGSTRLYRQPEQAALDGNTVELDRERANFADNAMRYQATIRFINGGVRTMLSAIRGE